jgi:hypothetical protein
MRSQLVVDKRLCRAPDVRGIGGPRDSARGRTARTAAWGLAIGIALGLAVLDAQRLRQPSVVVEGESLLAAVRASAGAVRRQDMRPFGAEWSGGAQLFWAAPPPVDAPIRNWPSLTLTIEVPVAGRYDLIVHHTTAPDYGNVRVFLSGRPAGDLTGHAPAVGRRSPTLGSYQLEAGRQQIVLTVVGKAAASSGYYVGLDRIELRRVVTTTPETSPAQTPGPARPPGPLPPPPRIPGAGTGMKAAPPAKPSTILNACELDPKSCCPEGSATEGCRKVAAAFLDVRIRSYVPPRFTILGKHYPYNTNYSMANVVADVTRTQPYPVSPGCRFNVTAANHAISESKTILEQAGELAEAWLHQWSSGIESAKAFIGNGVADGVCGLVDDSAACRGTVADAVKMAINVGLASMGIPPELPDIQELREHGIQYLAAQAASYVLGDAELLLESVPLDAALRQQLYEKAYQKAVEGLAAELNKVVPPVHVDAENPATWGHLEPAYAPHHAHVYIEVRVRPALYAKYLAFISGKPGHQWQKLYLHDLNHVYASSAPIEIPAYIPPSGIILPVALRPYDVAHTAVDTAPAQIPGVKISWTWLQKKFGIKNLVTQQYNYKPLISSGYLGSDYDLFYDATGRYKFRLLSPYGGTVIDWEPGLDKATTGTVWDAEVGAGVRTKGYWEKNNAMKNYYGRIDPAPRCDGKPTLAAYQ